MSTLTIFANFYINDEERFLRMKDSFRSFKDIDAKQWLVNVRGKYKFDTLFFLHEQLGYKLVPSTLESKRGWFYDTQQLLPHITTDFVFFWLEDHLNLIPVNEYREILDEMKESRSEYMCHSFWHKGQAFKTYEVLPKKEMKHISTFTLDRPAYAKIRHHRDYLISMVGIFSANLFKKIILRGEYFMRQWPRKTPLNFEKRFYDTQWLPIKYALTKRELFASIDDDHSEPGYSLQSRGLYPIRVPFVSRKTTRNPVTPSKVFFRTRIIKYIPPHIYQKKVQLGEYLVRLKIYLKLLLHGD